MFIPSLFPQEVITKVCCRCKEEKPLTEFVRNRCKLNGYTGYCKLCKRVYDNNYYSNNPDRRKQIRVLSSATRKANKELVTNYLKIHPCIWCGNTDERVLDFHHRDGKEKDYNIAEAQLISTKRLQEEINKCDVMCANHHRILHAEMRSPPVAQLD